jgi:transcriptional regulator with XRE-family HTH domain
MEFHRKLRDYRVRSRISQDDLGDIVGVSQNQVSRWERGVNIPDIRQAASIAAKLGLPLDHLLNDSQGMLSEVEADMLRRISDLVRDLGVEESHRRLAMIPSAVAGAPVVVEGRLVMPGAQKKGTG